MFGSSIINLWRAVSVIHLLYNISINRGVTANENMFINNVQTLSEEIALISAFKHSTSLLLAKYSVAEK